MTLSVLFTNKKRNWSGETAYIYELATGLHARGIPVVVASRVGADLTPRLRERGIAVHELHFDRRTGGIAAKLGDVRALRRIAADNGVNVLHANASWDTWVATVALRSRRDVTRIRTKHNVKRIRRHFMNRWLYGGLIQWLIAPSANVAAHLVDSGIVDASRVRHVPNGVPLDRFLAAGSQRPAARRRLADELGVPVGELGFVAAFVSRLSPRKHPELLADALRRLGPDAGFRAVFVGGGDAEPVRTAAAGSSHVHVLGHRDDPETYHAAADAFVLPSANEPFGMAAVEAMAAGTPVVLARAGAFPELIDDGESGLFFEVGDADGLARALRRLRDEPGLAERLARRAREVATRRFSSDAMTEATLRVYEEVRSFRSPDSLRNGLE